MDNQTEIVEDTIKTQEVELVSPAENRPLTPEEQDQLINALAESSAPTLQVMANAADSGDIAMYFGAYKKLMELFTPGEILKKGQMVPPWFIPRQDIQLIIIHTQLGLLTKAMADAGVFNAAMRTKKAKEGSGLVAPDGKLL